MAAEFCAPAVAPCVQNLVGYISSKIRNQFKIHSNYLQLQQNMQLLLQNESLLGEEDVRSGLPRVHANIWFHQVAILSIATRPVLEKGSTFGFKRSLNLKLSNDIVKWLVEAKRLLEEAKDFDTHVGAYSPPKRVEHILTAASIKGQPEASRMLAKIMDQLKDDSCHSIGIFGMGGVGKSTLVQTLNNDLENSKDDVPFSIVIYVLVSQQQQSMTTYAIQNKIAKRLNLKREERDDEESVARRLYARLEGEHFLLILDDLWAQIELLKVGIPLRQNGSKIIITSRFADVCNGMETCVTLKVEPLSEKEAWELFAGKVGDEVFNDEKIKLVAQAVVKECDGLPLALTVVGQSMRGRSHILLWEKALDNLQSSEPLDIPVETKVFNPLKWSYDHLESTKEQPLKPCFLFLCLFPEDHEVYVPDLVPYWIAEGLLGEHADYVQLERRCAYIVERLKDYCLLENGIHQNHVRMHDVVRDVGIWIASSEKEEFKSFICAGAGETELSIQKQLVNCSSGVKRISLIDIQRLPNCEVQCPQTSTLFLQFNPQLDEVPYSFLKGFQTLRILDLSRSNIKFLPLSLVDLGNLQALILSYCECLSGLPPLAALGSLQVLDCSFSSITRLPEGFEELTNLRKLNLSGTSRLKSIRAEKISKLRSLEYLDMMGSKTKCGFGKENEEGMHFEELLHLNHIRVLHIDLKGIPNVTIEYDSWFKRIKDVEVGVYFNGLHFSGDESVGWMLNDTVYCKFISCKEVGLMLDSQVRTNASFINLRELLLMGCRISFKTSPLEHCVAKCDLMPNLNKLVICLLSGLKSLSDFSKFLGLRFTKLSFIHVKLCHTLEHLLSIDDGIFFQELTEISIVRCKKLTQVFNKTSSHTFAPNLRSLNLNALPVVKIFEADDDVSLCKTLESLKVHRCYKLRKLPFGTQNGQCIPQIRGHQEWWDELEWDSQDSKMHVQSYFEPWI